MTGEEISNHKSNDANTSVEKKDNDNCSNSKELGKEKKQDDTIDQ